MSKDPAHERLPAHLSASVRAGLRLRKVYRQTLSRWQEAQAARRGRTGALVDASIPLVLPALPARQPNPSGAINKCIAWLDEDLQTPALRALGEKLQALHGELTQRGLRVTNIAGNFLSRLHDPQAERRKLWENTWVLREAGPVPGSRVLDVGGASTLFSFYLAHRGCRVAVVDNDWANCGTLHNARYVARQMDWTLEALDRDVAQPLPFPDGSFERVYSICVLEHLPAQVRQGPMREIGRVLKPGGLVGLTFDYDAKRPVLLTDRGLRYALREQLKRDVIQPSGLAVHGNTDWLDACPLDDFLGTLFLTKA